MRHDRTKRLIVFMIMLIAGVAVGYFLPGSAATGRAAPPAEPGFQFQCGNGICDPTENRQNCPADCGSPGGSADSGGDGGSCNNDGVCQPESGETTVNCGDCLSVCGDNICAPHEVDSCCGVGFDCTVAITCGDGICSACESFQNCATDCQPTATPVRRAPSPTPTDTATPETEETEEPEATDEPTDEPPPPPPPAETATPETAFYEQPPPDGQECFNLFGVEMCAVSFTFLGVTIVCCVTAAGIVAGTAYFVQKGSASAAGGGTGGGGGGGTPQQKVIPPQEGGSSGQPGGQIKLSHENEVLSKGQGDGGSINVRGEGGPDLALGNTLIETPAASSDPGIAGGIIPPLKDRDDDEEDEE